MKTPDAVPATLVEAIRYFSDPDVCLSFLVSLRWPRGVRCPHCGGEKHYFLKTRRVWKCSECRRQFSVKVGTIFEDSPLGLDKWLAALWMIANCKNGVSSYEIHRGIGITQKSAWFMLHRIRLAMQTGTFVKMGGIVEADETFMGGKVRNRGHNLTRLRKALRGTKGRRWNRMGKTAVFGILERSTEKGGSRVKTQVVRDVRRRSLVPVIEEHVEPASQVMTDSLQSYYGLANDYFHGVINHAERFAIGGIHTNGLENFWSLLKRAIKGTYVSVEPFHLFRYCEEQTWRFNTRKMTDGERFKLTVQQIVGRRLTYKALIGHTEAQTA